MYPASGTGSLGSRHRDTLSSGIRVLNVRDRTFFPTVAGKVAKRFGIQVEYVPGNWRTGAQPAEVEKRLDSDKQHAFKAVMVVHNETSTGVASRIAENSGLHESSPSSGPPDRGHESRP